MMLFGRIGFFAQEFSSLIFSLYIQIPKLLQ